MTYIFRPVPARLAFGMALATGIWLGGSGRASAEAQPHPPLSQSSSSPSAASSSSERSRDRQPVAAPAEGRQLPAGTSTEQSVDLGGGRVLDYTVKADGIDLRDKEGKLLHEVAYTAYLLKADQRDRPVVFAFNGGPGASSAYLQFVAIGPRRLAIGEQGSPPSAPQVLVPNAETWLDDADLVFIDPPGTGYSRSATEEAARQAYGVDGDISLLSRTIWRWLSDNGRLGSRSYLVGESYGGYRAPRLAARLQTSEGVGVSGMVLLSPVLDFNLRTSAPSPVAAAGRLVSFVASVRGRNGAAISREGLKDAEDYAFGEYLVDFARGVNDAQAVRRMVDRVAALTGLDPKFVEKAGGRVEAGAWLRELYRGEGQVASLYDGNVTAADPEPNAARVHYEDPVLDAMTAPLTGAAVTFTRETLRWRPSGRYELLSREVNRRWNWGGGLNPPDATADMRSALSLDGNLRVLVTHGLSDLVTTYTDSRYSLDQLPGFAGRVRLSAYPGGHMFYAREASRKALRDDVRWVFSPKKD